MDWTGSLTILLRYAFAVFAVMLAYLLRELLDPLIGQGLPFIIFYPTVVLVAWFGGLWPGLFSTVLGELIAWYMFIPPRYSFSILDSTAPVQMVIFFLGGTLISLLAESLHRARRKAQEKET